MDPIQFARANQAIQMACQNLVDPGSSPSQVTWGNAGCEMSPQAPLGVWWEDEELVKNPRLSEIAKPA